MNDELTEISVTYICDTDMAILVEGADEVKVWLPKSLIITPDLDGCNRGDSIEIEVAEWLALREGLI